MFLYKHSKFGFLSMIFQNEIVKVIYIYLSIAHKIFFYDVIPVFLE